MTEQTSHTPPPPKPDDDRQPDREEETRRQQEGWDFAEWVLPDTHRAAEENIQLLLDARQNEIPITAQELLHMQELHLEEIRNAPENPTEFVRKFNGDLLQVRTKGSRTLHLKEQQPQGVGKQLRRLLVEGRLRDESSFEPTKHESHLVDQFAEGTVGRAFAGVFGEKMASSFRDDKVLDLNEDQFTQARALSEYYANQPELGKKIAWRFAQLGIRDCSFLMNGDVLTEAGKNTLDWFGQWSDQDVYQFGVLLTHFGMPVENFRLKSSTRNVGKNTAELLVVLYEFERSHSQAGRSRLLAEADWAISRMSQIGLCADSNLSAHVLSEGLRYGTVLKLPIVGTPHMRALTEDDREAFLNRLAEPEMSELLHGFAELGIVITTAELFANDTNVLNEKLQLLQGQKQLVLKEVLKKRFEATAKEEEQEERAKDKWHSFPKVSTTEQRLTLTQILERLSTKYDETGQPKTAEAIAENTALAHLQLFAALGIPIRFGWGYEQLKTAKKSASNSENPDSDDTEAGIIFNEKLVQWIRWMRELDPSYISTSTYLDDIAGTYKSYQNYFDNLLCKPFKRLEQAGGASALEEFYAHMRDFPGIDRCLQLLRGHDTTVEKLCTWFAGEQNWQLIIDLLAYIADPENVKALAVTIDRDALISRSATESPHQVLRHFFDQPSLAALKSWLEKRIAWNQSNQFITQEQWQAIQTTARFSELPTESVDFFRFLWREFLHKANRKNPGENGWAEQPEKVLPKTYHFLSTFTEQLLRTDLSSDIKAALFVVINQGERHLYNGRDANNLEKWAAEMSVLLPQFVQLLTEKPEWMRLIQSGIALPRDCFSEAVTAGKVEMIGEVEGFAALRDSILSSATELFETKDLIAFDEALIWIGMSQAEKQLVTACMNNKIMGSFEGIVHAAQIIEAHFSDRDMHEKVALVGILNRVRGDNDRLLEVLKEVVQDQDETHRRVVLTVFREMLRAQPYFRQWPEFYTFVNDNPVIVWMVSRGIDIDDVLSKFDPVSADKASFDEELNKLRHWQQQLETDAGGTVITFRQEVQRILGTGEEQISTKQLAVYESIIAKGEAASRFFIRTLELVAQFDPAQRNKLVEKLITWTTTQEPGVLQLLADEPRLPEYFATSAMVYRTIRDLEHIENSSIRDDETANDELEYVLACTSWGVTNNRMVELDAIQTILTQLEAQHPEALAFLSHRKHDAARHSSTVRLYEPRQVDDKYSSRFEEFPRPDWLVDDMTAFAQQVTEHGDRLLRLQDEWIHQFGYAEFSRLPMDGLVMLLNWDDDERAAAIALLGSYKKSKEATPMTLTKIKKYLDQQTEFSQLAADIATIARSCGINSTPKSVLEQVFFWNGQPLLGHENSFDERVITATALETGQIPALKEYFGKLGWEMGGKTKWSFNDFRRGMESWYVLGEQLATTVIKIDTDAIGSRARNEKTEFALIQLDPAQQQALAERMEGDSSFWTTEMKRFMIELIKTQQTISPELAERFTRVILNPNFISLQNRYDFLSTMVLDTIEQFVDTGLVPVETTLPLAMASASGVAESEFRTQWDQMCLAIDVAHRPELRQSLWRFGRASLGIVQPEKMIAFIDKVPDILLQEDLRSYIISNLERFIQIADTYGVEKLQTYIKVMQLVKESPSGEIQRLQNLIMQQVMFAENPEPTFEAINRVFLENNLPFVGKAAKVMDLLYPNGIRNLRSPMLEHASRRTQRIVLGQDLLRVHLTSSDRSLRQYAEAFLQASPLVQRALDEDVSVWSEQDRGLLDRHLDHIEALFASSQLGAQANFFITPREGLRSVTETQQAIRSLADSLGIDTAAGDLGARFERRLTEMFFGLSGINTLTELKEYMKAEKEKADQRNRKLYEEVVSGQRQLIEKYDLLKGIGGFFAITQEYGDKCKEALGAFTPGSDATPGDADVSMVLPKDLEGGTAGAVRASIAAGYGPFLVLIKYGEGDRFLVTKKGPSEGLDDIPLADLHISRETARTPELFYTGVLGERHYGTRMGTGSTMRDAVLVPPEIRNSREALEQIFFTIARNGFFMSVADMEGKILVDDNNVPLFSPENFDKLRTFFDGVNLFDGKPFVANTNTSGYKQALEPIAAVLSGTETQPGTIEQMEAAMREFDQLVMQAATEVGITVRTAASKGITGAILTRTGSSARGTFIPGEEDIDSALLLDEADLGKKTEFMGRLMEKVGGPNTGNNSHTTKSDELQIRLTKAFLPGVGREIDIDLLATTKSQQETFGTHDALAAKFASIKETSGETAHINVLANIVLAKKILKHYSAYKRVGDGGLGGAGVELWILANHGNLREAFTTFRDAARRASSLEEFKRQYPIWDAGLNVKGAKTDNFIDRLEPKAYERMVAAADDFLSGKIET